MDAENDEESRDQESRDQVALAARCSAMSAMLARTG
jgi:hypothetical protein